MSELTIEQKEEVVRLLRGPQFDRTRHGSLYDRGTADSYYHRPARPHWWPNADTGKGEIVIDAELTDDERAEYLAGYEWNEQYGDKKEW